MLSISYNNLLTRSHKSSKKLSTLKKTLVPTGFSHDFLGFSAATNYVLWLSTHFIESKTIFWIEKGLLRPSELHPPRSGCVKYPNWLKKLCKKGCGPHPVYVGGPNKGTNLTFSYIFFHIFSHIYFPYILHIFFHIYYPIYSLYIFFPQM